MPAALWGGKKDGSKDKIWCSATAPAWVDHLCALPLEHQVAAGEAQGEEGAPVRSEKEEDEAKQPHEGEKEKKQEKGKRQRRTNKPRVERKSRRERDKQPREQAYSSYPDSGENRRHGYCVIGESSPCFGFLDAEFDATLNDNRSLSRMLNTFLGYYIAAWREIFANSYPELPVPTMEDFLVLDASSTAKGEVLLDPLQNSIIIIVASKHVHGPFYCAFSNVYHQAAFVRFVWQKVEAAAHQKAKSVEAMETKERAQECIVKVKLMSGIVDRPFVDLPVYSHNRCFRMYSCCKAGR